ncbi:MAG TPA: AEC family transporter [Desulfonatronum sp.]|nr:AEC family transporter [Desulfonatronum sp.]
MEHVRRHVHPDGHVSFAKPAEPSFMLQIITALTPIFLLILLGWVFKKMNFPGESFWPSAEKITYYVFFPALLFISLYRARFAELDVGPMALTVALAMVAVSGFMLLLRPRLPLSDPSFSSFFQGGLRPNTYVGISAAFVLFGTQGLTLAAMVIAVMIPLANLISVSVVSWYGQNHNKGWAGVSGALIRNPLILSCLLGIGANIANVPLEFGLIEFIVILSQASLSLGLLSVGAGLRFQGLSGNLRVIGLSGAVKLVLLPFLAAFGAWLFGLGTVSASVIVVFAALPCGPAAYVLARQMGGDRNLMAEIITVQTVAAFLTMPVLLTLF